MSTSLPGQAASFTGQSYFYSSYVPLLECNHGPSAVVWGYNDSKPTGCGLCHLKAIFETEIPKRLHEYELLAENGNPETSPRFWSHIESQMGLMPPGPEERLSDFRVSRARAYRAPSRGELPVTAALWKMMGYQPKLAKPLIRSLLGQAPNEIAREFTMSSYLVHETLGKAVRLALRYLRN